jgi:hypothetical protein
MCSILRTTEYTLYRVQGFLVSRQIWSPPPQASVSPPTFGSWGGGDTLACGGGGGGANSDEGTGNLVLYV